MFDSVDHRKREQAISCIRNLTCCKWMMAANLLAFLLTELTGFSEDARHMLSLGAAYEPLLSAGQYYRLFTSMFLHFGMEHLLNNMLVLYVVGERLERAVGRWRFLLIYLGGGVAGNVLSWQMEKNLQYPPVAAGASGAVFAIVGGMLFVVIANRGRLADLTFRQMLFMAAASLYMGVAEKGVDNAAHFGGLVAGFLLAALLYLFITPGSRREFSESGRSWRR